jgi:hypothetical protein
LGWFKRFREVSPIFVETGTFRGDGVERALEDYEIVFSVESDPVLYNYARGRFEDDPRVYLSCGDSGEFLESLDIPEPVVFYLDAHWYGKGDETPLPLLRELKAISERPYKDVVIIDDMRLMGVKTVSGGCGDWPLAEFNWVDVTKEKILETCPGEAEMATDIDRLIIYRNTRA